MMAIASAANAEAGKGLTAEARGDLRTACDHYRAAISFLEIPKPLTGIQLIAAERQRQIEKERWTPEHDDQHTDETLPLVAALYAAPCDLFEADIEAVGGKILGISFNDPWPASWDDCWDRRQDFDRKRQLIVAGALIAAELDRLNRAEQEDV